MGICALWMPLCSLPDQQRIGMVPPRRTGCCICCSASNGYGRSRYPLNELHLQPDEYIYITERDNLEHFFVGQSLLTQKDIVRFSKQRLFDYSEFFDAMQNGTVRFASPKALSAPSA